SEFRISTPKGFDLTARVAAAHPGSSWHPQSAIRNPQDPRAAQRGRRTRRGTQVLGMEALRKPADLAAGGVANRTSCESDALPCRQSAVRIWATRSAPVVC